MPIAVFNEKAQRYQNTETGKFMKTSAAEAQNAPQSSKLGASSIVSALRSEFKGLNAHLAFRFDSVIAAMQGTAAERRDALISSEDTDKPPGGGDTDPPAGKKSFMETLQGLNPFKDGIGTKMTILLLTGVLVAISQFGDKLIKPLASFLEWADGDPSESVGEWTEKFKKWWKTKWEGVKLFWEDMKTKFDDIKEEYEKLKVWWEPKWASFKSFIKLFEDMFTGIHDWVMAYDVGGKEGVLDKEEIDKLVSDVWSNIKKSLWALTGEAALGIMSAIGLLTIGKMALATILSPTVGLGIAAPAAAGLLGTAALIAVVAAGLWLLVDKTADAYEDAITDEANKPQNFDGKEFLARFFGGANDEGGWWNAIITGMKTSIIGGAAGGALAGTAIFPGVGTALGAAVGALIGGVIGATGGYHGKNKIKSWLDQFELAFNEATDALTTWFDGIVVMAKAIVTPGVDVKTAMATFNASNVGATGAKKATLGRIEENNERIAKLKQEIEDGNTERTWYWSKSLFGEDLPYAEQIKLMEAENYQLRDDIRMTSSSADNTLHSKIQFEKELKRLQPGINDKYYDANDVPKMSILNASDSHDTSLSTFVGSSLDATNKSTSAILLASQLMGWGPAYGRPHN